MALPTTSGPVRVLNTVAGQSPEGVALLFKKYGIQAPVSGKSLMNALILYKRPFADDLYDVVISTSHSDGDQHGKEKFAGILNQVIGAATGIFTILKPKQAAEIGIQTQTSTGQISEEQIAEPPVKKFMGIPIPAAIGIGIIVLLFIVLLFIRKK